MTSHPRAWDDYFIPGTFVLRNKFIGPGEPYGITDGAELNRRGEQRTALRLAEIRQGLRRGDSFIRCRPRLRQRRRERLEPLALIAQRLRIVTKKLLACSSPSQAPCRLARSRCWPATRPHPSSWNGSRRAVYRAAMRLRPYVDFLPATLRARALPPTSTWWRWRECTVHVARASRPDAHARLLVVHGAGGHAGALWPLASIAAGTGFDVAAVDLPLYGRTIVPDRSAVRYADWVDLLCDLIAHEDDRRPLVVLGASMGGMLALDVAGRSGRVAHVVATCLLDPRDAHVRVRLTRFGRLGVVAPALAALVDDAGSHGVRSQLARTMVPMAWFADLARMSRDPELSRRCATDHLGGGARVPLGFLASYLRHDHAATRATTPVHLVHPTHDAWTPMRLSLPALDLVDAATAVVPLLECGHFPIEQPGLDTLMATLEDLARRAPASG